jgi:CBS domain-containing protein
MGEEDPMMPGQPAPDDPGAEGARSDRSAPVAACLERLPVAPLLVSPEEDLRDALVQAVDQRVPLLGVVDGTGRLVGVLPTLHLAEALIAREMPEAFLQEISDERALEEFAATVEARTVGQAMLPPATVQPETSVAEAFRLIHARRLPGALVVDHEERPVAYLDLSALALFVADDGVARGEG